MANVSLNIVSFDVPFPPDYGGIMDIFYKIKTLNEKGVDIVLHCFQYNRPEQKALEKYCKEIHYYKRGKGAKYIFAHLPYIVSTRNNPQLLKNLQKNNYPILLEGLHTCFFLNSEELKARHKIVRTHNIEHDYYKGLQKATKNPVKKLYFCLESRKLRKFESIVKQASELAAISQKDSSYFSSIHHKVIYLPAFHPFNEVTTRPGSGDYFLYHGNLSVEENIKVISFLLNHVFNKTDAKLVIAGKNPSAALGKKIAQLSNIQLKANPAVKEMDELIKNAQACILPTFQATGLKLKLLVSLFSGRYVLVNGAMVNNTGLESLCKIAEHQEDFIAQINSIKDLEFSQEQIDNRKQILKKFTSNYNIDTLLNILKEHD